MTQAPHSPERDSAVRAVIGELENWFALYSEAHGVNIALPTRAKGGDADGDAPVRLKKKATGAPDAAKAAIKRAKLAQQ